MTLSRLPLLLLFGSSLAIPSATADEIRPDEIQFRRQAATRMVFDATQNIPLSSLRPAQVVNLDLMHPELQPDSGITWEIKDGGLSGSPKEAGGASLRWAGAPITLDATEAGWIERLAEGATPAELGEGAEEFCRRLLRRGLLVAG